MDETLYSNPVLATVEAGEQLFGSRVIEVVEDYLEICIEMSSAFPSLPTN